MYIESRYNRGVKDTLAQVAALQSPEVGETVFCKENGRVLTFDGDLWMCDDFIKSINGVNSTRSQGDTMIYYLGPGTAPEVVLPTYSGEGLFAGIVAFTAGPNEPVALAYKGIYKVNVSYWAQVPTRIGYFLRTTSIGQGRSEMAITYSTGVYGWTLEVPAAYGLVKSLIRGKVELN